MTVPHAPARGKHAQPGGVRDVEVLLEQLDGHLSAASSWPDAKVPDGFAVNAKRFMIPREVMRDADRLEDDVVRRILAFGLDLANQVPRFRAHTFDDLATFLDLLGEQYGRRKTAGKGGYSCTSFDGRLKVQVGVQDRITFGPELQVARELVHECLADWAADSLYLRPTPEAKWTLVPINIAAGWTDPGCDERPVRLEGDDTTTEASS